MNQDEWKEWKDWYRESIREWRKRYKKALREWTQRARELKAKGLASPMPPIPPIPPMHSASSSRANVVASRLGDEELNLIDMLIEARLFNTRSEAVAYLVSEGIKARQDVFDKVSSSLEEIRKIRKEAEEHVKKLKEKIGIAESKESEEIEEAKGENGETCLQCGKDLSDLPEDISICPYCGTKLGKE